MRAARRFADDSARGAARLACVSPAKTSVNVVP